MRGTFGAQDDETERNAPRDVRDFRDRARALVESVRDTVLPRLPHVGDSAVAHVESFGALVPQYDAAAVSAHEARAETVREAWSTAFSAPREHRYGCAVCGTALPPLAARDRVGREVCDRCDERMTLPPAHLRFAEEPVAGGLLLWWSLPGDEQWRRFLRDAVFCGVTSYTVSVAVLGGLTNGDHGPMVPTKLAALPLSVWAALAFVPLAFTMLGSLLAAGQRLAQRVEVRVFPDALDVSPRERDVWGAFRANRVLVERGQTRIPIPIPVESRVEAEHVVRQIESAMRRVVAPRRGYRG